MNNLDDIIIKTLAAKKSKEFLLAHPDYRPNFWQCWRQRYLLRKYKQGWPIAYLAGHKEFYGLNFLVNKHTLIPRPDTELLVEQTVKEINKLSNKKIILIDVGTGTGCIPIAIQKILDIKNIKILATDISRGALRLAKKNARKHEIKIDFVCSDLLNNKKISQYLISNIQSSRIIITANLPYLAQEQFQSEPSIQKEPKNALIADNDDGLSLYSKLLKQIQTLISNIQHLNTSIYLEIDPSQSARITEIIKTILPNTIVEIKKDLAGRDRLVIIRVN